MSNTEALRAAAQQALVALVHHTEQTRPIQRTADAIAALRAALAQPAASEEPADALWLAGVPDAYAIRVTKSMNATLWATTRDGA